MANSLTFTLSPSGGSGIEYAALYHAPGKYATYIFPQGSEEQIIRAHIPGTDGNIKILGGRINGVVRCGVRYMAETVATCITTALTDFDSLAGVDVTVTFNGSEWQRCSMRSAMPLRPARSDGRGYAYADWEIVFDCDS